jgi:hypothetical protein
MTECDSHSDRLCGLVVSVLGYRSGGPGSIPGTTKKKVVNLERGPLRLVSIVRLRIQATEFSFLFIINERIYFRDLTSYSADCQVPPVAHVPPVEKHWSRAAVFNLY